MHGERETRCDSRVDRVAALPHDLRATSAAIRLSLATIAFGANVACAPAGIATSSGILLECARVSPDRRWAPKRRRCQKPRASGDDSGGSDECLFQNRSPYGLRMKLTRCGPVVSLAEVREPNPMRSASRSDGMLLVLLTSLQGSSFREARFPDPR